MCWWTDASSNSLEDGEREGKRGGKGGVVAGVGDEQAEGTRKECGSCTRIPLCAGFLDRQLQRIATLICSNLSQVDPLWLLQPLLGNGGNPSLSRVGQISLPVPV